ncbi:hypothetical protein HanXRQr2_Chr07g0311701 [Helianthus annuus]|uniref:Uncharacterized protein n=1 Tax=Helianthus annuus TaxID=4232 RepID=A0A9K3NHL1_HELAN|nr:hypothetical protein HanXRQr2_Chr07g0311701 [Helianthus annuus]KAJ0906092.1 hypothetical protein HanPSC8_Chr07g0301581 [Helianthus annuus]
MMITRSYKEVRWIIKRYSWSGKLNMLCWRRLKTNIHQLNIC